MGIRENINSKEKQKNVAVDKLAVEKIIKIKGGTWGIADIIEQIENWFVGKKWGNKQFEQNKNKIQRLKGSPLGV